MFLKKLNYFFLILTIVSSIFLIYNWYKGYKFKNNPLKEVTLQQIKEKQYYLQNLAYKKFGINKKIPIEISNSMPSKLFGAATYSNTGQVKIFLNKKRFKESTKYMIDDVLPHEYAHAVMFLIGDFTDEAAGHSKKWQNICKALEGLNCNRFVNNHDVIIGKTNFF